MARSPGESETAYRRRILALLIDQRLRFHAIDRFGFVQAPVEQVEKNLEEIRASFPDLAAFQRRLKELGLSENDLKQLVTRQLMVLTYVGERLGPRVFVSLDDIKACYRDVMTPELTKRRQPVPPLDDVRETIRQVLREQRLNEEIERWTEELRGERRQLLRPGRQAPAAGGEDDRAEEACLGARAAEMDDQPAPRTSRAPAARRCAPL